jgi:hypothetical protein
LVGVRVGDINCECVDTASPVSVFISHVYFQLNLLLCTSYGKGNFYVWQGLVLCEVGFKPNLGRACFLSGWFLFRSLAFYHFFT